MREPTHYEADMPCSAPRRLLPELVERVASFLDLNEVAGTLRLLNKDAADLLRGPQHTTIRLSLPFPSHAFVSYWAGPIGSAAIPRLTLARRQRLFCSAATNGDVFALSAVAARVGIPVPAAALTAAAVAGKLEACDYLLSLGFPFDAPSLLVAAARAGQGEVCEALLRGGHCKWSQEAVSAAALAGHLVLCDLLIEWQPKGEKRRVQRRALAWKLAGAAHVCSLARLQQMFQQEPALAAFLSAAAAAAADSMAQQGAEQQQAFEPQPPQPGPPEAQRPQQQAEAQQMGPQQPATQPPEAQQPPQQPQQPQQQAQRQPPQPQPLPRKGLRLWTQADALASAAGSPTADWAAKVEWLEGLGFPKTRAALSAAAAVRSAGVARLNSLQARGGYPQPNKHVAHAAAHAGNAAALRQLCAAGVQPEWDTGRVAGVAGHLEVLQVLQEFRYVDLGRGLWHTSRAGQVDVVAWCLQAIGEERDGEEERGMFRRSWLTLAAMTGSVALLASGRELGCPLRSDAYTTAARAGGEEALCWLADNGCPLPTDGAPYLAAFENGDMHTLCTLKRLGLAFGDDTFFRAAMSSGRYLPGLHWLLAEGCPVDWACVEADMEKVLEPWRSQVLGLRGEEGAGQQQTQDLEEREEAREEAQEEAQEGAQEGPRKETREEEAREELQEEARDVRDAPIIEE